MRRLVISGGLGVFLLSVVLVACGGSNAGSSGDQARRFQDMWEIDKIEKDFHHATTTKNIDLMLSLYAPNATMTVGPGVTASGLDEIRRFWLEDSAPFASENEWISKFKGTPYFNDARLSHFRSSFEKGLGSPLYFFVFKLFAITQ